MALLTTKIDNKNSSPSIFRKRNILSFRKFFLTITAISFFFLLIAGLFIENTIKTTTEKEIHKEMNQTLSYREEILQEEFKKNKNEILFLHSTPPIQGIVRATKNNGIDLEDNTDLESWKKRLTLIFTGFLESNQHIAQARLIGIKNEGMELVRVQRKFGNIQIVTPGQLQKKQHRDYFKEIINLKNNQIYISDISLNKEFGELEFPYWPTYRVGMPIYDSQGNIFGAIIINIDARYLTQRLLANLDVNLQLFILDSNNFFVIHPIKSYEFGKQLGNDYSWNNLYKTSSSSNNTHTKQTINSINSEKIRFIQSDIPISSKKQNRKISLIVGINEKFIQSQLTTKRIEFYGFTLSIVLIVAIILWRYQITIYRRLSLLEANAEYEAIVGSSFDAIIGLDKKANITSWNSGAQQLLGYSPAHTIGTSIFDFLIPDSEKENIEIRLNNLLNKINNPNFDTIVKRNNGSLLDVSATYSPIYFDGEISGFAIVMRDITEQKNISNKINQLNDTLEKQVIERTKEVIKMRDEAISANEIKSDFIANVSHEIRTPMNGILGSLKLLGKGDLNDDQLRYLKMAETSISNLTNLVNDILDLSKVESGKIDLEEINFDLLKFLSETIDSMAIKAHEKGLEVILDVAHVEHHKVKGDPHRLRQIITNLFNNATKFTDYGEIVVKASTFSRGDDLVMLQCEVKDTGQGISKEGIKKLFQSFSQEDSSVTRRFGGSGLGLSICKKLTELMNGNIDVVSEKGEGSSFIFNIPLVNINNDIKNTKLITLKSPIILIAEKNIASATALTSLLESWGAIVNTTYSTEDAISYFEDNQNVDIVLIGANIETESSISLLDHIKTLPNYDSIKIIVMAIHSQSSTLKKISQKELTIIEKPVTPFNLAKCLSKTLNEPIYEIEEIEKTVSLSGNNVVNFLKFQNCEVLLVDDNEINRAVGSGILEDLGLKVITAENGQDALDKLHALSNGKETSLGLILMDCQMPIMDGFVATQQIRKGNAGKTSTQIPIIAMTANAMSEARDQCEYVGMNDYLTKPIDTDELEQKLATWLQFSFNSKLISNKKLIDNYNSMSHNNTMTEHHHSQPTQPITQQENNLQPAESTDQLSVWDCHSALKRVGSKKERLHTLVDLFLKGMPNRIDRLQVAADEHNFSVVESIAHEIKGVTSNIAGLQIASLSSQIEDAARNKSDDEIEELLPSFHESYSALSKDLSTFNLGFESKSTH